LSNEVIERAEAFLAQYGKYKLEERWASVMKELIDEARRLERIERAQMALLEANSILPR
jgi:hypothetical protein